MLEPWGLQGFSGLNVPGGALYYQVPMNPGAGLTQRQPWQPTNGLHPSSTARPPSPLDMPDLSSETSATTPSTVEDHQGSWSRYGQGFLQPLAAQQSPPTLGELPLGQGRLGEQLEAWESLNEGYRTGKTPRRDVPEDHGPMDSCQDEQERSVGASSPVDDMLVSPAKGRSGGRKSKNRVQKTLAQKRKKPRSQDRKKPAPRKEALGEVEGVPPSVEQSPYPCLFCIATLSPKSVWQRHVQDCHLVPTKWYCKVGGCQGVFSRKDNLKQHLNGQHIQSSHKWNGTFGEWVQKCELPATARCGFCSKTFTDFKVACNHIVQEFEVNGRTMKDWKGDWGFPPEWKGKLDGASLPSERSQE